MDVWQNPSRGNCNASKKLVELFIVLDGKSQMAWNDTALLVITSSVSCELEDLGAEVFKDSCQVHGSTSTHARGVLSLT